MKNIILTVLLIFVALAGCTNALRRKKTDYQTIKDLVMLGSCPKGEHWIDGHYTSRGRRRWSSGYCKKNRSKKIWLLPRRTLLAPPHPASAKNGVPTRDENCN